jgi:hypothetical protein
MGEGLGGIGVELNSHSINRQPQPGNGRKQPISPYFRLICRKPRQVSCESQSETRGLKERRKMGESNYSSSPVSRPRRYLTPKAFGVDVVVQDEVQLRRREALVPRQHTVDFFKRG